MLVTLRGQTINKRTVVLYWNDEDDEKHSNVQLNSLLVHPIRFFLTDSNQYLPLPYPYVDLARILLIVATICLLKSFSIRAFYSVICIMSRMTGMWKWNITTVISFHDRSTFSVGSRKLLCKICPLWLKKQLPFWKMKGEKTLNPDEEKW